MQPSESSVIRVRFPNAILGGNADRHFRTHNANRKQAGAAGSAAGVPLSEQERPLQSDESRRVCLRRGITERETLD